MNSSPYLDEWSTENPLNNLTIGSMMSTSGSLMVTSDAMTDLINQTLYENMTAYDENEFLDLFIKHTT